MKKLAVVMMVMLMTLTLSAQLTWRGYTEFPVDIRIVERGVMITGAQNGDTIYSYFTVNGINYASWYGICSLRDGTIAKALGDSDLSVRTGFLQDEEVSYAVKTGGVHKKVIWTGTYEKSEQTLWLAYLSEEVVQIEDNPYYSLSPVWPAFDAEIYPYAQVPTTAYRDRFLYKYIQWNKYLPQNISGWTIQLVEGTGRLTVAKSPSQSTYTFTKADMLRRSVTFKIVVTPLQNSASKDTSRTIILKW